MLRSTGVVSGATFASRVLGLVREQVTAYLFGAGDMVDAFKSAFRIPNLLRDLFAEGALSAGFIPLFSEKLRLQGKEEAFRFAGMVFGALTALLAVVIVVMMQFTPQIATVIAGGFEQVSGKLETTILLGRIMMPFLMLISLSALLMGVLNSLGRFGIPAMAPAMLNFGMILTALTLSRYIEPAILSLSIGVLIGGAGQFVMQYVALRRIGFRLRLVFDLFNPELYRLLLLILPMTVGLAANQINIAVVTRIASDESGAVSFLDYAFRLLHLPLGVFAVAIATVSLPRLAGVVGGGDNPAFGKIHSEALRLGLFLSLPVAVMMVLMSEELCAVIYQYGRFTRADTIQTARVLSLYALGIPFFALARITVPAFYAMKDTKTPALVSLISVTVNVLLCFEFRALMGFTGLALAAASAGAVNILLLTYLLRRRIKIAEDRQTLMTLMKVAAATLACGLVIWLTRQFLYESLIAPGSHRYLVFAILGTAGLSTFTLISLLLGVDELRTLSSFFRRRGRS